MVVCAEAKARFLVFLVANTATAIEMSRGTKIWLSSAANTRRHGATQVISFQIEILYEAETLVRRKFFKKVQQEILFSRTKIWQHTQRAGHRSMQLVASNSQIIQKRKLTELSWERSSQLVRFKM
jgi:hypothetical protein